MANQVAANQHQYSSQPAAAYNDWAALASSSSSHLVPKHLQTPLFMSPLVNPYISTPGAMALTQQFSSLMRYPSNNVIDMAPSERMMPPPIRLASPGLEKALDQVHVS